MRRWLFAVAVIVASCSDSATEPAVPISGVYMANVAAFADSLRVEIGFGFDEVTPGTADGGVRLVVFKTKGAAAPRVFKAGHTLERITTQNGKRVIRGTAHFPAPFHTLEFAGQLDAAGNYDFQFKSPAGSGSAVAKYGGAYVKPGAISLRPFMLASLVDVYTGTYTFTGGATGSMVVKTATADGYGGTSIGGTLSMFGLNNVPMDGDVWANNLQANTAFPANIKCGPSITVVAEPFAPTASSSGSYTFFTAVCASDTPDDQGDISISARH